MTRLHLQAYLCPSSKTHVRDSPGVIAVDGLLYVVGGDDGTANLTSVEVYDPPSNAWTMMAAQISIGRSYAGLAVVEKPGL